MADLEVYDALIEAETKLKKELVNQALSNADLAVVFAMLQGVMEARYKEYIRQSFAIERRDKLNRYRDQTQREEPQ